MSRYAPIALPALAGALFLLLTALWLLPNPAPPPSQRPAILSSASSDATDAAVNQWGSTALAQPLFTPGRRPADQPGADADSSLPRLSAIIITAGGGAAVFAADGQKPQVIAQGGSIAGYVLNRVAPDHVELAGPDGSLTLRPQFASTAAATDTASADTASPPPATPPPGQTIIPLNPSSNPALMIEQNY